MANQEQRLNELKQKYASVLRTIEQQGVRMHNLHIQDNKLFIRGDAPSQDAKNRVWDQIKLVDPQFSDLTADINVVAQAQPAASAAAPGSSGGQKYTVQAGDTLSAISKRFYGNSNEYMKIFNANKDKLSDPNKVQVGQELVIP